MCFLNGWHPFESIRSCEIYYLAMPSSSDLGATKTASTKPKSNSIIGIYKVPPSKVLSKGAVQVKRS